MSERKQIRLDNDNWNVIDVKESSYSISELHSGEMDGINLIESSDIEGSNSVGSGEAAKDAPSRIYGPRPESAIHRSYWSWFQRILVVISVAACVTNVMLLGLFTSHFIQYSRANTKECSEGRFHERVGCQFESYMGKLVLSYRTEHQKPQESFAVKYLRGGLHIDREFVPEFVSMKNKSQEIYSKGANWVQLKYRQLAPKLAFEKNKLESWAKRMPGNYVKNVLPWLQNTGKDANVLFKRGIARTHTWSRNAGTAATAAAQSLNHQYQMVLDLLRV